MPINSITWDQFRVCGKNPLGLRYDFEDLCRLLFKYEFVSEGDCIHSNPNQAGIEVEPYYHRKTKKYISFQAKFFDNRVDYNQIEDSVTKITDNYKGKLDCVYLYCNKAISKASNSYMRIENQLNNVGIEIELICDTAILDLVLEYPLLGEYFFNNHNITHDWLVRRAKIAASNLGDRYNEDFNIDTETLEKLSIFVQDNQGVNYFNNAKKETISKIRENEWKFGFHKDKVIELKRYIETIPDIDNTTIQEAFNWQKSISKKFDKEINYARTENESLEEQFYKCKDSTEKRKIQASIDKMELLLDFYCECLNFYELYKQLIDAKILVIKGEAGAGKTQLLANKTFTILNNNGYALLILGGDCCSNDNIFEQLRNNLRIDFGIEELIDILEIIGEKTNKIVPIFIDAINESWNKRIWKNALTSLQEELSDKRYVKLVISIRNEYEKDIIPDSFYRFNDVKIIVHDGFEENSLEAVKEFLNHYGIVFSPIHLFTSKIYNPLFLTLYCRCYETNNTILMELYERILDKANMSIHNHLRLGELGYSNSDNLVTEVVECISKELLLSGKREIEREVIEKLSVWNSYRLPPRPFIKRMCDEGLLHEIVLNNEYYFRFSFDQMNDFYLAKTIMSMHPNEFDLRDYLVNNVLKIKNGIVQNRGEASLFVNVCYLYAKKYHNECIDIIELIKDEDDKEFIFELYIENLGWRNKVYLSFKKFFSYCVDNKIQYDNLWNATIVNSIKPGHILNADNLYDILINFSLVDRDFYWTTFVNELSDNDRAIQLIEEFNKGNEIFLENDEQTRLLLILLSWFLTSSNRYIRDTTSKAMIEILKNNFKFCKYLLNIFKDVNDPYVIQRLYGIVFGACTRTINIDEHEFKELAKFVYETIFNQDLVYPDILLRDYARLIVEYFVHSFPNSTLTIDLNKIKPPYKSIPLKSICNIDYSKKQLDNGLAYIKSSMCFEGIGMYGDFGRYVFQGSVNEFDIDDKLVYNLAMDYIINELHYDERFDYYDQYALNRTGSRHHVVKTERIGKKYQWITMYNFIARISDNYPMVDNYGDDNFIFKGAYQLRIRDFDPTLNENYLSNDNLPYFNDFNKQIKEINIECKQCINDPQFDENEWIKLHSNFFTYQKESLILTDERGNEWVVLSRFSETDRSDLANDKLLIWNFLYGYFVTEEQITTISKYANKKIDFLSDSITNIFTEYGLFNREYPWSHACKDTIALQFQETELNTGDTQMISYETIPNRTSIWFDDEKDSNEDELVIINDLVDDDGEVIPVTNTIEKNITHNIGKILNTTQYMTWEEQYDASKTETISIKHPCAKLINDLKLKQNKYDGYYYNQNNELIVFDTKLTNNDAGLVIRKEALDEFVSNNNYKLVWFIRASKEVHGENLMISAYKDWTGLLIYEKDTITGEYYIIDE